MINYNSSHDIKMMSIVDIDSHKNGTWQGPLQELNVKVAAKAQLLGKSEINKTTHFVEVYISS